eukprot:m.83212 g.83212  ORF g.83212 m.83212 type:complete len:468 (-) comp12908_c0_seq2:54-1457(-)
MSFQPAKGIDRQFEAKSKKASVPKLPEHASQASQDDGEPLSLCPAPIHARDALSEMAACLTHTQGQSNAEADICVGRFEEAVSAHLGMGMGAFMLSDICTTLAAIAATSQPVVQNKRSSTKHSDAVMVHYSSRIIHEDKSVAELGFSQKALYSFRGSSVLPYGRADSITTFNDIVKVISPGCRLIPKMLIIEIPHRLLGGISVDFDELRRIRALAKQHKVHMHMDGERLWETQPFYGRELANICAMFDSVSVSFCKGVGAFAGAMLLGPTTFIQRAKAWRIKHEGPNTPNFPNWLDCEMRWARLISSQHFQLCFQKLSRLVHIIREDVIKKQKCVKIYPKVVSSCSVHVYLRGGVDDLEAIHQEASNESKVVLWQNLSQGVKPSHSETWCFFEWSIAEANLHVSEDSVRHGWEAFFTRLLKFHSTLIRDTRHTSGSLLIESKKITGDAKFGINRTVSELQLEGKTGR